MVEYLLGSLITLLSVGSVFVYFKLNPAPKPIKPMVTQSTGFASINKIFGYDAKPKQIITQATKYEHRDAKNVALYEDSAYWIEDNVFYKAGFDEDGRVDIKNKEVVDTINADGVELKLLTHIVEKLTEGNS